MRLIYFICGVWFLRKHWRTELPGIWQFTATHAILPTRGGIAIEPRRNVALKQNPNGPMPDTILSGYYRAMQAHAATSAAAPQLLKDSPTPIVLNDAIDVSSRVSAANREVPSE